MGSTLIIETATAACSVALLDGGAIVAERHEIVSRGHAEKLVPMIADLLDGARPDAVLVDCGPGSFTGLRVGLAAAQGLAIGWQVPVSGFSSLALLAAMSGEASVAAALNGGHGELFVQDFGGDPLAPEDESPRACSSRGSSGLSSSASATASAPTRSLQERPLMSRVPTRRPALILSRSAN